MEMHDREIKRSQGWHVWVPVGGVIIAGVFTLFGIWLKSVLGGP
jgi:hypothetical protein